MTTKNKTPKAEPLPDPLDYSGAIDTDHGCKILIARQLTRIAKHPIISRRLQNLRQNLLATGRFAIAGPGGR